MMPSGKSRPHPPALGRWLLPIGLLLVLAGCSRVSLIYHNLDWVIAWRADDYLDLTPHQSRALRERLQGQLDWHCRTQLPRYVDWLERLQARTVSAATLRQRYHEAQQAVADLGPALRPTLLALARDLDDRQLKTLAETFREKQRERHEDYLALPLPRQIRNRATRMQERAADWFGTLDAAQRQRILLWSHVLGDSSTHWAASQARWEQGLLDALGERHRADFPERLDRLLKDRRAWWTPTYRERFPRYEQAGLDLALDLYALASETQRQHLMQRIADLRRQLDELQCG